jgi:hypothetical protein
MMGIRRMLLQSKPSFSDFSRDHQIFGLIKLSPKFIPFIFFFNSRFLANLPISDVDKKAGAKNGQ